MATAASNQTIGAGAEVQVFDSAADGGQCEKFLVGVRPGSANGVLVRIPGVHAVGEQLGIPAGASQEFQFLEGDGSGGIEAVYLQGDGGNATVDYGIISRSARN